MPEPAEFHNVISELGKLTGIVQEGFRAVHQRQDYANGKLTKHEERLNKIDTTEALNAQSLKGIEEKSSGMDTTKSKWIDRGLMTLVAIILQLGLLVLIRTGIVDITPAPKTASDVAERLVELEAQAKKLDIQTKESPK